MRALSRKTEKCLVPLSVSFVSDCKLCETKEKPALAETSNTKFLLSASISTLHTKAPWSKRREVFLSILSGCYTTLNAKLFEDAATLFPGYVNIASS